MKKSHLTLAILTAVLVSACGGSSSNDDATKDHGKPITPSKTTPTTPSKTTPTTPTTNDNSAKKPSTPTTSTTPSDSTPSTPTKTTTPTPSKTTPTTTLTSEQIVAKETKKRDEAKQKIEEKLQPELNEAKNKEQELETKLADITNPPSAEEKQKLEDQIAAAKLKTLEKYKAVLEEGKEIAESDLKIAQIRGRDLVQFEKNVAKANASLALQQATTDYTEAKQAKTLADRASGEKAELVHQYTEALKTLKNNASDETKNLIKQFDSAVDELQRLSGDKDNPNQEEIAQQKGKIKEAMDKLGEKNEELKTLGEKIVKADGEAEKLQEAAKKLDFANAEKKFHEKQAALNALLNFNGVRFSEAKNDTFGEVRSVSYDEGKGKWSITFTGAEGAKDDKVEFAKSSDNSAKYGTFTAAKDSNPAKGVKATAYSAYGYVGDKFFSVGKLISLKDYVSKAIKAAAGEDGKETPKELKLKYQGTAFVKANDKNQVAYFEATANFGDKPTLNGSFSHFQNYTDALPKDTPKEKVDDKVKFESTINPEDSSFKSADDAKVKVQGFFYQATENKSGVGGLVDSKKEGHVFKGAFGGEQVTALQPAATQPTTTQTATTQTATTQTATTQTAGQQ